MDKRKTEGKEKTVKDAFKALKLSNDKRARKRRIIYAVIISSLIVAFVIVSIIVFFRVRSVVVVNGGVYSDDEVLNASGITYNEQIFALNDSEISARITKACPSIKSVKIERHLPTEVALVIDIDEPNYYMEIENECFVLSKNLRVLERMWNKGEVKAKYPTIKKIGAGEVKSAIVGSNIEFVNSLYEEDTRELISYIEKCDFKDSITSFDITDRYNIKIVYESRLQAMCGDIKDMNVKLKFFSEIAKDLGKASGTVDIKDVSTGYALVDNNKTFD